MGLDTQRFDRKGATASWASFTCGLTLVLLAAASARAQTVAGSAVYVRRDTDRTTVIAPRLHVGAPVTSRDRVDLVYTADVWTSASIDIRSSASLPVTEQRDELDTTVTHDLDNMTVHGTYRYSHEPDYESHGAIVGGSWYFAQKSSTFDFRLAATFDRVGRAGYPGFSEPVRNLGIRLGFTQLIDPRMFVQVIYELMEAHGYNGSPYRFVGFGSNDGLCTTENAVLCAPESNPSERLRHAFAANLRRALGDSFAIGLGYRFYIDDWQLRSHTILGELSYSIDPQLILSLRYRYYTQTAAKQYQPAYDIADESLEFFSNDKELSTFVSHRAALDIEKIFDLDERGHELSVVLSAAPSLFQYANYRPVSQIEAIEVTLATVFKL